MKCQNTGPKNLEFGKAGYDDEKSEFLQDVSLHTREKSRETKLTPTHLLQMTRISTGDIRFAMAILGNLNLEKTWLRSQKDIRLPSLHRDSQGVG